MVKNSDELRVTITNQYRHRISKDFMMKIGRVTHGMSIPFIGVDGKSYLVCFRYERKKKRWEFGKGWKSFCNQNKLELGDELTFQHDEGTLYVLPPVKAKTNEMDSGSSTSASTSADPNSTLVRTGFTRANGTDETIVSRESKKTSLIFRDTHFKDIHEKIEIMKRVQSQLSQEAHECFESIPELYKIVDGVQALVSQLEDLKQKYIKEQAKGKELYNHIQEIKGNIRVFCRCRPSNKEETSVDFDGAKDGELGVITGNNSKKLFKFDRVYTPEDGQVDVFADASPLVVSVLDGYNVCIFAYGQTGTGKTFTMEGTLQDRGVNYRAVEQLYQVARERSGTTSYDISVSVLEVYNEQIRDLLATSPASNKLEIKQSYDGSHHVRGLEEVKVENINEVWNLLQAGSNARAVGSNNVNEHSSRSHCMLSIMVEATNLLNGDCTKSKLWLVDLAGSERLAKTDVQGARQKETRMINKSLSNLGDVINALATKSSHIPYRNSKLTQLLQDSLGGGSKTLMFVNISPSKDDVSETLSSLLFATRVRGVELGPARKNKGIDKYKSLQEKNKELESQLESLHIQSEKQNAQLVERLKSRDDTCTILQQKVKELECKLRERDQSDSAAYHQQTLDSTTTSPQSDLSHSHSTTPASSSSDPLLLRSLSSSRLNAGAPEFVPGRTTPLPQQPRMIIPPRPPPHGMLHMYHHQPPFNVPVLGPVPIQPHLVPVQNHHPHRVHPHHQNRHQNQQYVPVRNHGHQEYQQRGVRGAVQEPDLVAKKGDRRDHKRESKNDQTTETGASVSMDSKTALRKLRGGMNK